MAPIPLTKEQLALIETANTTIRVFPQSKTLQITDHTVSSACLTSHARTFTGINTFHFSGSLCAENVAFSNAAANGCSSLNTPGLTRAERGEPDEDGKKEEMLCVVAVTNNGPGVINPCGRCRQFMFDYYPDMRIVIKTGVGEELGTVGVNELMPYAYISKFRKSIVAVAE